MLDTFLISFRLKILIVLIALFICLNKFQLLEECYLCHFIKSKSKIFVTILNTIWEIISVFRKNNILQLCS